MLLHINTPIFEKADAFITQSFFHHIGPFKSKPGRKKSLLINNPVTGKPFIPCCSHRPSYCAGRSFAPQCPGNGPIRCYFARWNTSYNAPNLLKKI